MFLNINPESYSNNFLRELATNTNDSTVLDEIAHIYNDDTDVFCLNDTEDIPDYTVKESIITNPSVSEKTLMFLATYDNVIIRSKIAKSCPSSVIKILLNDEDYLVLRSILLNANSSSEDVEFIVNRVLNKEFDSNINITNSSNDMINFIENLSKNHKVSGKSQKELKKLLQYYKEHTTSTILDALCKSPDINTLFSIVANPLASGNHINVIVRNILNHEVSFFTSAEKNGLSKKTFLSYLIANKYVDEKDKKLLKKLM